jgi:archaellum biogenesis ATPase FlaH
MTHEPRTSTPSPHIGLASPNGQPTREALEQLDIQRLLAQPPPIHQWVWDGYIERRTLTVLHGDGGTGKSILAGHLARATSVGGQCLARNTTQGAVLIIDAENPLDEIARRMHALDYQAIPTGSITYYRASDPILGATGHLDVTTLHNVTTTHQPTLVILDSQRGLWAGDEKEAIEIRPLYRSLQAVAEHLDCAIVVIHHDRRTGSYSGSSDIHNSADTRLHLERPDPDKPERILHHAKARSSAELLPASYTFTFDQQLGLFTFTQPREPTTDTDIVFDALDGDEWLTIKEIAPRAGMREIETKTMLWQLVRAGEAQSMIGPPGRSKRAVGFRKLTPTRNYSQTREQSGAVAESVPSANCSPAFTPPLGGEAGAVAHAELLPPQNPSTEQDYPYNPDEELPF